MSEPDPPAATRRDEIIEIATRLFVERGYAAVSTRAIAIAAGVSQPTLYSHFSSKHDLVEEMCIRWFHLLYAHLRDAAASAPAPPEALRVLCRAYVDLAWRERERYFIAFILPFDEAAHPPSPRFRAAGGLAYGVLKACVEAHEGIRDREVAAQSVWAALHGLSSLVIWRSGFGWVDRDRLRDAHVEMICRGVGAV